MSKTNPTCRVCGIELNNDNWYSARQKKRDYICKECELKKQCLYREANRDKLNARSRSYAKNNPEKRKANYTKTHRKNGHLPMSENKECNLYLGVHIGEPVLSKLFKKVVRMPFGNPGYDIICNNDKKIDVKISCIRKTGNYWSFNIKHNMIADYFLCAAFDNREDLNLLYIWLIPGHVLNHLSGASISESTLYKWDAYRQDPTKAIAYCDSMKSK